MRSALSQYVYPQCCSGPVSAATRFRYAAARWGGVHLVCILIASRLLRGAEGLAVGLKRPALSSPPVKQRWFVLELQQRGSNLLGFRHVFVRGIKARFLVCAFGICHVSHPADISIAHTESSCADI